MLECAQNPHENPSENVEKHVGKAFAAEMERSFPQIASGRRAGRKSKALFENETILDIAAKYGKTLSQVILRWHIQRGAVPISKSTAPGRQIENISIFDFTLSEEEVAAITALSRPDGRTFDQDSAVYEEFWPVPSTPFCIAKPMRFRRPIPVERFL